MGGFIYIWSWFLILETGNFFCFVLHSECVLFHVEPHRAGDKPWWCGQSHFMVLGCYCNLKHVSCSIQEIIQVYVSPWETLLFQYVVKIGPLMIVLSSACTSCLCLSVRKWGESLGIMDDDFDRRMELRRQRREQMRLEAQTWVHLCKVKQTYTFKHFTHAHLKHQ